MMTGGLKGVWFLFGENMRRWVVVMAVQLNILKITEVYTLSGRIVWYVNYSSIRLL